MDVQKSETEQGGGLLNLVNASGFGFQLRIEEEVRRHQHEHPWAILSREHRWRDALTGNEGFIDLVLKGGITRLVIECKRTTGAHWVFLMPDQGERPTRCFRVLWTASMEGSETLSGWDDVFISPLSVSAMFCAIRGQGERDQPMLERLCGLLLRSVEALADEEVGYERAAFPRPSVYVPLIVTTAELYVCRFQPKDVDITSGTLSDASFEAVPFVHFRKSLSTTRTPPERARDLSQSRLSQDRSVIVVQADRLTELLKVLSLERPAFDDYPWDAALKQRGQS